MKTSLFPRNTQHNNVASKNNKVSVHKNFCPLVKWRGWLNEGLTSLVDFYDHMMMHSILLHFLLLNTNAVIFTIAYSWPSWVIFYKLNYEHVMAWLLVAQHYITCTQH